MMYFPHGSIYTASECSFWPWWEAVINQQLKRRRPLGAGGASAGPAARGGGIAAGEARPPLGQTDRRTGRAPLPGHPRSCSPPQLPSHHRPRVLRQKARSEKDKAVRLRHFLVAGCPPKTWCRAVIEGFELHFVLSGRFLNAHLAVMFQMAVVLTIDKN